MECKIKDLLVHYEIFGKGIPIIMLHGFPLDSQIMIGCMEPIFRERTGFQRIYMDFPGMGQTPSAPWINSTDDILQLTLDFIQKILLNQSFIVVGESYGGYILNGVISKMRKYILGSLSICPMIIADSTKRILPKRNVLERDIEFYNQLSPALKNEYDSILVIENKRVCSRYQKEIPGALLKADMQFLNNIQQNSYGYSWDPLDIDQPYQFPALFILGRQDDIVGFQDALQFSEHFTRASYAVLEKAGHNAQVEQQFIFEFLVKEWLNRVKFN
ncbi:MAG: alpha/beta fold hydrolase [Promethearchaeota archaeon]